MKTLVLAQCGLSDRALSVALEGWRFALLTRLDLSRNTISEGSALCLASIVASGNLVDLDVRDTKLRGPAAAHVAAALGSERRGKTRARRFRPTSKRSSPGPLVSAAFSTSDHLSERPRRA